MMYRFFLLLCVTLSGVTCGWAQDEQIQREFKQKQLRWFLHAAEDDIWRATARADGQALQHASQRLGMVVEAWRESPKEDDGNFVGSAHSRGTVRATLMRDFFSWCHFYRTMAELDALGALDATLRAGGEAMARDIIRPLERGPNNRAYHFALGAANAAKLFPEAPEAARWRAYAEAVWHDWWTPGDTYEPGYIAHHFPHIIALSEVLGKTEELRSDRARLIFSRLRDHVSATGRAVQGADPGGPDNQSSYAYVEGLCAAAKWLRDGTFLGAAQRALAVTSPTPRSPQDYDYSKLKYLVEQTTRALASQGISASPAPSLAVIQHAYPATVADPDRAVLSSPEVPANPYAAMELNDGQETLFHGHEDIRGNILHFEANDVLYLRGPGWMKWTGMANTFVVADEAAEFPLALTRGLTPRRWYGASANLRLLRYFQADDDWRRTADSVGEQYQVALTDVKTGLGYAWANPKSLVGEKDTLEMNTVTLRFLAIPEEEALNAYQKKDHLLYTLSFDPKMMWVREYNNVAPALGALDFLVRDLRLSGPSGVHPLASLTTLSEGLQVLHFAPGTRGEAARVIPPEEWDHYLKIVTTDTGPALQVHCPAGRLDLVIPVPAKRFDLTKEFPRIDFDYQLLTETSALLRTPISVEVNGLRPRSLYVDGQQGGVLTATSANAQGSDRAASVSYAGVYSYDSDWTRRMVLTKEGVLVVVDDYATGENLRRATGGPVWQLPNQPIQGDSWMDGAAESKGDERLLVWFGGTVESSLGVQVQSRFNRTDTYAVYARSALKPWATTRVVSVLMPHHAKVGAPQLAEQIRLDQPAGGSMTVTFVAPEAWATRARVQVQFSEDGQWSVSRN
jgi:hypothetical protein